MRGCGCLEQGERGVGGSEPGGTGVVVRTHLAQGQVCLGCEQDDQQTGAQVEPAVDHTQADTDGHERDRQRGQRLEDE